eukprot:TRINITY_DN15902_c0_g1_i1.p1 TRINITY_DN15902_c0_g1~~TRINITY_DN15902_c0_g1_i1.p1  ORF type:complete len:342 (+),score=78.79 TRINITY_DN15902_c0_g1_i1:90-1115(+)
MGGCVSIKKVDKESQIDEEMANERSKLDKMIKLLLLGAGESGKTTVSKQMRIIHLDGFTNDEKDDYKTLIINNLVSNMQVLVHAAKDLGHTVNPQNQAAYDRIFALSENSVFTLSSEMAQDIRDLWKDSEIQRTYSQSSSFQLNDSAKFFFEEIDRIAADGFVPNEPDILRCRGKTTGIIETDFILDGYHFKVVDVGGQRSERKKWVNCFQDVTAVLFCVALSEYDLKMYEESTTNRMDESLRVFKEISNNRWFSDTPMILLLNKKDLFEEKIKEVPLTVAFPDYDGPNEYDPAVKYIEEVFRGQIQNPDKPFFSYVTCATDTKSIQSMFNAIKDRVVKKT